MRNNENISDELLAAYLDGNTNEAETMGVLEALNVDSELREVMDIALDVDDDTWSAYDVLPMMKMAAESGDNVCSVLCEAYILHKRGVSFDENEVLELAHQKHWLTSQGTPLHAIGEILSHYGMMVTHRYDATMEDIRKAIAVDNEVMVVVDNDKLFPERPDEEDEPNHAVVVTGVDEHAGTVAVFDPQYNSQYSFPRDQFESAWRESQHYMVRVLQTVDDYEPKPINLEGVRLTDDLLELQEAIAENAHEVWAAARMREGWTYGRERDDTLKKHPDLLPYSALSDSEKEYDRQMAFDTIKLVKKLGFDLVKVKG